MPRFSVIVPAFRVQAYLHACLDSVLAQSFKDHEVIVVDDCSPDACGPIADEYARRDHRVTALHLPRNTGLGPARNAGMARAGQTTSSSSTATTPCSRTRSSPSPTASTRPASPTS